MGNLIVMRGLMNFNVAQNLGACMYLDFENHTL